MVCDAVDKFEDTSSGWRGVHQGGQQHGQMSRKEYPFVINWFHVALYFTINYSAIRGLLWFSGEVQLYTVLFAIFVGFWSLFGVTAGSHRLWAHRSYKARTPLRIFLAICQTVTLIFSIRQWVTHHRAHHKFTDTDADPHDSTRGFFYSHTGWGLVRRSSEYREKVKTIDFSDLDNDWVVVWQDRLIVPLNGLFALFLPTWIPVHFWGEDPWLAWYACCVRIFWVMHTQALINSAAHKYGSKPYDSTISPTNGAIVSLIASGEGWHNYHHCFPWDYRAAELPYWLNTTTMILDACAWLGLAYDMRSASPELVLRRKQRTGEVHDKEVWGIEDPDMDVQEKKLITVVNPLLS